VLSKVSHLAKKDKFRQVFRAGDIAAQLGDCNKTLDECITLFTLEAHVTNAAAVETIKEALEDVQVTLKVMNEKKEFQGVQVFPTEYNLF